MNREGVKSLSSTRCTPIEVKENIALASERERGRGGGREGEDGSNVETERTSPVSFMKPQVFELLT